jgi:hypothetical protein
MLPAVQQPPLGPQVTPRGFRVTGVQVDSAGFLHVRVVIGRELYERARIAGGALQLGLSLAGASGPSRFLSPGALPLSQATLLGQGADQVGVEYRLPWSGRDTTGRPISGPVAASGTAQLVATQGTQQGVLADAGAFSVAPPPSRPASSGLQPLAAMYVGQAGALVIELVVSRSLYDSVRTDPGAAIVRDLRLSNAARQVRAISRDSVPLVKAKVSEPVSGGGGVELQFIVPWDGKDDAGNSMGDAVTVQALFGLMTHSNGLPVVVVWAKWRTRLTVAAP